MIETELPGSGESGNVIFKVPSASRWLISRMLCVMVNAEVPVQAVFRPVRYRGATFTASQYYFAINKLICQQRMFGSLVIRRSFFTSLSNGMILRRLSHVQEIACHDRELIVRNACYFHLLCQRQWRDRLYRFWSEESGVAIAPPNDRFKYPCCPDN